MIATADDFIKTVIAMADDHNCADDLTKIPESEPRLAETRAFVKRDAAKTRGGSKGYNRLIADMWMKNAPASDIMAVTTLTRDKLQSHLTRLRENGDIPLGLRRTEWAGVKAGKHVVGSLQEVCRAFGITDERKARRGYVPGLSLKKTGYACFVGDEE